MCVCVGGGSSGVVCSLCGLRGFLYVLSYTQSFCCVWWIQSGIVFLVEEQGVGCKLLLVRGKRIVCHYLLADSSLYLWYAMFCDCGPSLTFSILFEKGIQKESCIPYQQQVFINK